MTAPDPLDRAALLSALRTDGDRVATALAALPPDALQRGAYEQGWTVKDLAAHLASIEWTYPRLIDRAAETGTEASAAEPRGPTSNPAMDDYNARQVAKRRDTPLHELIDEFRANRSALIDAVERADEGLLQRPIRSFGGASGSLLHVLWSVAVEHVRTHLADLQRA